MNEIICPNCDKAFKIDEAGFADIRKQVRDHQFEEELTSRLTLAKNEKDNAVKLAEANIKSALQEEVAKKDKQLLELKSKNANELAELLANKEKKIAEMESRINNAETQKKLEVSDATKKLEKERDDLANTLKMKESEKELHEKSINEQFNNKLIAKDDVIKLKEEEIERLRDFKQRLSTKMVGESLEQHCEIEFNEVKGSNLALYGFK